MILQYGKPEQPQNLLPTFGPDFAVRKTIGLPHFGQNRLALGLDLLFRLRTCARWVAHDGFNRPVAILSQIFATSVVEKTG